MPVLFKTAGEFFCEERISQFSFLPMDAVTVTRPELLFREGEFSPETVLMILVPYYTGKGENLSAYAVSRDYHLYMRGLGARLVDYLSERLTPYTFRFFADHSPIDERLAAVRAGLGVLGDSGLLLNPRYGSFHFIGEVITDCPPPGGTPVHPVRGCEHCGACRAACPTGALTGQGDCLSAITQRKGELTEDEISLMYRTGTVWGCDVCQLVCPHNRAALSGAHTPIRFFHEERIPHLTAAALVAMSDEEFSARAFSWRGRATIARNLAAYEERKKKNKK